MTQGTGAPPATDSAALMQEGEAIIRLAMSMAASVDAILSSNIRNLSSQAEVCESNIADEQQSASKTMELLKKPSSIQRREVSGRRQGLQIRQGIYRGNEQSRGNSETALRRCQNKSREILDADAQHRIDLALGQDDSSAKDNLDPKSAVPAADVMKKIDDVRKSLRVFTANEKGKNTNPLVTAEAAYLDELQAWLEIRNTTNGSGLKMGLCQVARAGTLTQIHNDIISLAKTKSGAQCGQPGLQPRR